MKKQKVLLLALICLTLLINISALSEAASQKIVLQLNNSTAYLDGVAIVLETAPYTYDGNTMVPLRFISEAFGYTVNSMKVTEHTTGLPIQEIYMYGDGNAIKLIIGRKTITTNKGTFEVNAAPVVLNGRTMVPIRVISEAMGYYVYWDQATKVITISKTPLSQEELYEIQQASIFPEIIATNTQATTSNNSQTATPKSTTPQETIVYVTSTGTKYHRSNCSYLKSSKISISLSAAKANYEPCSVCNPPR